MTLELPLIAVDVGNSRYKLARFDAGLDATLPAPSKELAISVTSGPLDELNAWLAPHAPHEFGWWLASVNRPGSTRLIDWLRRHDAQRQVLMLTSGDLPLAVNLPRPDMVGIDRLLSAVVANAVRPPNRPAVVVDIGTATTVDLVSAAGAFQGGSILPGLGIQARALHEFTDLLPSLPPAMLAEPPPPLGQWTLEAMASGLYWGSVGAIRELIRQYSLLIQDEPAVLVTGGGSAKKLAELVSPDAHFVPHATVSGIAIAAREYAAKGKH